ncbi:hypothetical protein CcI6DRAFT_04277 [Frankia sp. CcI6]|nr:hypothetical protein CcI6DRAFT_04277 [Frankia sp. CcI6]
MTLRVTLRVRDLPVLVPEDSVHAMVLRPRGARPELASSARDGVAFRAFDHVGAPGLLISRLNSLAYTCPYQRFSRPLAEAATWLGVVVDRYSLS